MQPQGRESLQGLVGYYQWLQLLQYKEDINTRRRDFLVTDFLEDYVHIQVPDLFWIRELPFTTTMSCEAMFPYKMCILNRWREKALVLRCHMFLSI